MDKSKKTVKQFEIRCRNASVNHRACADGIDTGTTDGSGSLTVTAEYAHFEDNGVVFVGVVIEAASPEGGKGYAEWDDDSLISEAKVMLREDYCR